MEEKGKILGYSSARAEMTKKLCEDDLASEPCDPSDFNSQTLEEPEKESTDGGQGTRESR